MKKFLNDLTIEDLKSSVIYDRLSGKFFRVGTNPSRELKTIAKSSSTNKEYIQICVKGRLYYAHRLAYLYVTGKWPTKEIDHIDGNGLNNKWENLREVSKLENSKNQKIASNNTTGIMGVSWHKTKNKWGAYITVNNQRKYLGWHRDFFEACCARKSAEKLYAFHDNHGK